ncbi:MAG: sigma-70 family RNA polymerase sigma factor [Clostridia bacterium]|nr:sigma-70 family RNA polymerase sigma factor [Clostridia bacterium]
MKKIFYILDGNGEFLSEDGKKRYRALTGQALYQYLRTEEGKKKFFDVWQDDDRAVMVGVEVPSEKIKIYAAEQRRRRYIKDVMKELDISITSLESIVENNDNRLNGEEALASFDIELEDEIIRKITIEEVRHAIRLLPLDEQKLIKEIFVCGKTERELSKKYGVSQVAIHKRKNRIFQKIKKFFDKN